MTGNDLSPGSFILADLLGQETEVTPGTAGAPLTCQFATWITKRHVGMRNDSQISTNFRLLKLVRACHSMNFCIFFHLASGLQLQNHQTTTPPEDLPLEPAEVATDAAEVFEVQVFGQGDLREDGVGEVVGEVGERWGELEWKWEKWKGGVSVSSHFFKDYAWDLNSNTSFCVGIILLDMGSCRWQGFLLQKHHLLERNKKTWESNEGFPRSCLLLSGF